MKEATAHPHNPAKEVRLYTAVLGALIVLTFITVGVSYLQFGNFNVVVAVLIASIKASLVALFFMHLRHDKPINALIFLVSIFMLGLFLMSIFTDFGARDPLLPSNYKGSVTQPGGTAPVVSPTGTTTPAPSSNVTPAPSGPASAPAPASH